MTDVDSRLARVEERVGSVQSQIIQIDKRVDQITPMLTEVATLNERQASTHASLSALRVEFKEFREKVEQDGDDDRRGRQQFNRWAIGLGVTIILGLLSVAMILLTAGVQG